VTLTPSGDLDAFIADLSGRPAHRPVVARDAVSVSAIRSWCDVMGERGAAFTGVDPVAPPATLQMWTFPGLAPGRPVDAGPAAPGDLDFEVRARLADKGLTATLATATDQEFVADLRPGDLLAARDLYTSVSGLKNTGLGRGHFLSSRTTYSRQDGMEVGRLTLTVFVFEPRPVVTPRAPAPAPPASRPAFPEAAAAVSLRAGAVLPDTRIAVTPTLIVAGAMATRDVYPVHHDRDFARSHGNPDIVMNILTTNGLLSRVVGEWSGGARLTRLHTRLRAPAYPHRTLTIGGLVAEAAGGHAVMEIRAATELGVHAEASAHVTFGRSRSHLIARPTKCC
jgi:acyl dehydratase